MKHFYIIFFLIFCHNLSAQIDKTDYKFKEFDSIVIQTFNDYTFEVDFNTGKRLDTIIVTGNVIITREDAEELNKRLNQKDSYGQSQATTPVYDLKIKYYKKGEVKEEVKISLWTNNLIATFPLEVQRQGDCLCDGDGGYCCSKGGISFKFKKYLLGLLEKYNLPIDKEELLFFSQGEEAIYKSLKDSIFNVGDKILLPSLYFNGQCFCRINENTEDSLILVVNFLKKYSQFKVEFGTHTDTRGSDKYNLAFSTKVSKNVVSWLTNNQGIDSSRVVPVGYGESNPLFNEVEINALSSEEEKEQKRRLNRRHILTILELKSE